MFRRPTLIVFTTALLAACGGGGNSTPTTPPPPPPLTLQLELRREAASGLDTIVAIATATRGAVPTPGLTIAASASRGTASAVVDRGDGRYELRITPAGTGEHPVTVAAEGVSATKTALVLFDVHEDWDQPEAVAGLVNTPGYEDGVTISPDGEYLFVQTGPFHWSGSVVFQTARAIGGAGGNRLMPSTFSHPWIDTLIGPYTAPERPGFPDGRLSGKLFLHNSLSWGVGLGLAPNWGMSTQIYGFRRQTDGTFTAPFRIAFADANDGLVTPYGIGLQMFGNGAARVVFSLDMPSPLDELLVDVAGDGFGGGDDEPSGIDLYTADIALGQDNLLGTFLPTGTPGTPPRRSTPFSAVPVQLGNVGSNGVRGTQGNVGYHEAGGQIVLFTDDEYDRDLDSGEIAAYVQTSGVFPGGTWQKVMLPSVVNSSDDEIQPHFTGGELFFTRMPGPDIWRSAWNGPLTATGLADARHWSDPVRLLAKDPVPTIGACIAVGEPTSCVRQGQTWLYFVYAVVRAIDDSGPTTFYDLDFNAGCVRRRR